LAEDALQRLGGGAERGAREVVAGLGLDAPVKPSPAHRRPRVVADMVATVDGRAAIDGRSVGLGNPADRALLRELRTAVDAILVGRGTLAAERYARLLDDDQRARRVAAGLSPHPLVVTVARRLERLAIDAVPLFAEAEVTIVVFTESTEAEAPAPVVIADLEVVRCAEPLTLVAVLRALAAGGSAGAGAAAGEGGASAGVRSVLCEGGPTLLRRLVAEGALDDLLLTVAPLLAAGTAPSILDGPGLDAPATLTLRDVHRGGNHLFLHYGLGR
jgi:riboflavin biosynthesis pyrimidine reductase